MNLEPFKVELEVNMSNKYFLAKGDQSEPIRKGFGQGLLKLGQDNPNVVACCADLTESTQMSFFANAYPDRFIEIGIAEQNLVTVGSGLAAAGKIPFVSSYAAFSPGRNWEQIRTTICLNDVPVKIIGSHAGVSVGPDGATHQMLEDLALMRVLPNMIVLAPCDSVEAKKATIAMASVNKPVYMRLAREASPIITTEDTPFEIGKAEVFIEGSDISLIACGAMTAQALIAAKNLKRSGISAEVINNTTIKPLDQATILASAKKTKKVVTIEEAQIAGGLGSAVSELLSEKCPTFVHRIGIKDRFGESGTMEELYKYFGLSAEAIELAVYAIMN